jgi:Bacterial Ig-like domain
MAKQLVGLGGVVGAVVAAILGTVAGCGDSFGSGDCHASRTCGSAGGESAVGGASEGNGPNAGADANAGGSDSTSVGGTAASAGAAGASEGGAGGADLECHVDDDCSDAKAENGLEACDQGACVAGNPPPTIGSVTPVGDAVDVEPDSSVVIAFSEPLDPKTVTSTTIQVLDGKTVVPGKLAYTDGTVTFTPTSPLTLLAPYTVSVTTGVTDEQGASLLTAFSSSFSIRDGSWTTIDVVKDIGGSLSGTLPIASDGSVLLAWSGNATEYCPVWARWFLRGAPSTAAKAFTIAGQTECNFVSSAGNATGVSAVVWAEPDAANGTDVEQYRAGAWQATPSLVSKSTDSFPLEVTVAPNGLVTFFEHSVFGGTKVWTTDVAGKWPADGAPISTFAAKGPTSVAFDSKGNGFAVWRAKDPSGTKLERTVVSRLTTESGTWGDVEDLPGSVTATTSAAAQRGAPTVAIDSKGDALALWVDASSTGKLMASRFSQSIWAEPESVSGALTVDLLESPPALAFDGKGFIAAWTAQEAGKRYAYTARYDLKTGWDTYQKQQTAADDGTSAPTMPRIVSDKRGNSLLVFAKGAAPAYTLMYQRYSDGVWGTIQPVPGGAVANAYFENLRTMPLSMSANGSAALAWTNYDAAKYLSTVRLASFF